MGGSTPGIVLVSHDEGPDSTDFGMRRGYDSMLICFGTAGNVMKV